MTEATPPGGADGLPIGIAWRIGRRTAWSIMGLHLFQRMKARGHTPVLLSWPDLETIPAKDHASIGRQFCPPAQAGVLPFVLHPLGNATDGSHGQWPLQGERNVGLIAIEEQPLLTDELHRLDLLVTHSTWNQALLADVGLNRTILAWQGVDPDLMRPWPRMGRFGDRFAVFSGGKLEYRKGHDIVLAAFRRFQARHQEAILVTAWHSPWPELASTLAGSPHAPVAPELDAQGLVDATGWARENGVPADAFSDLGFLPHHLLPRYYADCDVALFPNRCEGGTNMVAMEAMACGVPVILSANTGHLDVIRDESCLVLRDQGAVANPALAALGWGESSVEEAEALLEQVYAERAAARARAASASAFIRGERTWARCADTVLAAVEALAA